MDLTINMIVKPEAGFGILAKAVRCAIQDFKWGDYSVEPNTRPDRQVPIPSSRTLRVRGRYRYTAYAVYGNADLGLQTDGCEAQGHRSEMIQKVEKEIRWVRQLIGVSGPSTKGPGLHVGAKAGTMTSCETFCMCMIWTELRVNVIQMYCEICMLYQYQQYSRTPANLTVCTSCTLSVISKY